MDPHKHICIHKNISEATRKAAAATLPPGTAPPTFNGAPPWRDRAIARAANRARLRWSSGQRGLKAAQQGESIGSFRRATAKQCGIGRSNTQIAQLRHDDASSVEKVRNDDAKRKPSGTRKFYRHEDGEDPLASILRRDDPSLLDTSIISTGNGIRPAPAQGVRSTKCIMYMEHGIASCKEEVPEPLFMCSKLYIAAFEGRTEEVTGLLTGSHGVTAAPANGRQTSQAARENAIHPGLCCSTGEVTAERSTLLHVAAGQGHRELIAELVLRDSALLSSANSALDTPLHCAARAGHADAVEDIVRLAGRGGNVEEGGLRGVLGAKNGAGDTALHVAARHGHGEAAEALMEAAPELASEVNGAGVSPLYLAVMSGSVRAVAAIVVYRDASAAGPNSQNALHAAVLQSSEMVFLLLRWRPTLATDLDTNKSSPLHFASSAGDCSIIQEILTYAPPGTAYFRDSNGLSALHAAALMGNLRAVRLLLKFYPASADIRDNHGRSFLHAAAMKGHSSIVSYVIKNRMLEHLLNEQDKDGNTPLHLAVLAGEYKVVGKLLSSGKVQAHIMNNIGETPSDLIENSSGFFSMVWLVIQLFVHGAQFMPKRQDHVNKWNGQNIMKWREATSKNLAIVSTLVATVAFSAAFNVPGSYGSDGKANLNGNPMYKAFLLLDGVAVTTAVMATILLIYGRASRSRRSWMGFIVSLHFLWLSLFSMMLGFVTAIAAVTRNDKPVKIALPRLIYCGLYLLIILLQELAMPGSLIGVLRFAIGGRSGRQWHVKRRISQQYPFVVIYAVNMFLFIVINSIAIVAVDFTANQVAKGS
ncbi:hypothetical protein ACP70R_049251 [Stipagrostis hirtigluma subsp. patula]